MSWIVLSHAIEKMVFGKGFVRIQDEMAIVIEGGGIFDPEVAIGNAVVAPTWKGELGGVSVKDGAQGKDSCGGFLIAFPFLNAVLCRVNPSTPSESVATEVNFLRGTDRGPRRDGESSAKDLESGLGGVPVVGHG